MPHPSQSAPAHEKASSKAARSPRQARLQPAQTAGGVKNHVPVFPSLCLRVFFLNEPTNQAGGTSVAVPECALAVDVKPVGFGICLPRQLDFGSDASISRIELVDCEVV